MSKKEKRYRVSLAVHVPMNYETKVSASSEKDALKKAFGEFKRGDMTNVDENSAMWDEVKLALHFGEQHEEYNEALHGYDPNDILGVYIGELDKHGHEIL